MKKQWVKYSIRIWLTTVFVGGLTFGFITNLLNHVILNLHDILSGALPALIYGLIYSLPAFILCLILTYYLSLIKLGNVIEKIILCVFSTISIYITLMYVAPYSYISFKVIYIGISSLSILFFRLNRPITENS